MFYRFQFFSTSILSLLCFSFGEGLLFIQPTFSKNMGNSTLEIKQNKQLSLPEKTDKTRTFDYLDPVGQGYQQPTFEEENGCLKMLYELMHAKKKRDYCKGVKEF